MKHRTFKRVPDFVFLAAALLIASPFFAVFAQSRDYMTPAEVELVRENQFSDLRTDILIKMIDRRFTALGIDVASWKQSSKGGGDWGEAPKGTRPELLWDIKQLLQKAIDDIDDAYAHPGVDKSIEPPKKGAKNPEERLSDALKDLGKAARRYLPVLKTAYDAAEDDREAGSIIASVDFCEQIIEASEKPVK